MPYLTILQPDECYTIHMNTESNVEILHSLILFPRTNICAGASPFIPKEHEISLGPRHTETPYPK